MKKVKGSKKSNPDTFTYATRVTKVTLHKLGYIDKPQGPKGFVTESLHSEFDEPQRFIEEMYDTSNTTKPLRFEH